MNVNISFIIFNIFIVLMLILDLGILQRKAHFPKMREAIAWSIVWIVLSLIFNAYILFEYGTIKALEFFTGYIVEKALSVDNIFIFIVIFSYFAVPLEYQHKVLFWGVISAIIMRAVFIVLGAALVAKFHWVLYIFGAFLIFTALKLALQSETEIHPERNPFIKACRKFLPVTLNYEGSKFIIKRGNKYFITPLFLVLVMIESTDLVFATDSITAIFAITQDTFIIYTSNIFAILGLRALYFVIVSFMKKFRYLKYGLSLVLGFIGIKMLIEPLFKITIHASLFIIFIIILLSILLSLHYNKKSLIEEKTQKSNNEN